MKIATSSQMRAIDLAATEKYGIPGSVLMENAGCAVAEAIVDMTGEPRGKVICILCGKGNNGGDGAVAARWMHNQGSRVLLFLTALRGEVSGDAALFLSTAVCMGIDVTELTDERAWEKLRISAALADVVVDALVGTGMQGELQGAVARAAELINSAGRPVLAVDIPSGVDSDNGQIGSFAVEANRTVTFALPKIGHYQYPGAAARGRLTVAPIGIPAELLESDEIRQNLLTVEYIRTLFKIRKPDSHKGDYGQALIVAGSQGLSGAAALSAHGAVRGGIGRVTVGVPESLQIVMETKTTEAMTLPLPEALSGGLGRDAVRLVNDFAARVDVLAVGPGLGRQEETLEAVREWIRTADKPLVLDADALHAVAGHLELLSEAASLSVLTPHPGEMMILTGQSVGDIQKNRTESARRFAAQWGCIMVLKGAATVVAFPDGEVYLNPTGNAAMAAAGTGDVLTGLITAFIAQGMSSHEAALAGVFTHGTAGEIASKSKPVGMTASDLAEAIPVAMFRIMNGNDLNEGETQ